MENHSEDADFAERMEELKQKVKEYQYIMNIARQEYNAIKQDIHKTGHSFADFHLEFEYEATKLLNRVR